LPVGPGSSQKHDGISFQLAACPFKPEGHDAGGASIFVASDGRITASCFHAKCHWGWNALRLELDPGFDDRAEEAALSTTEGLRDPHRLARLVLDEFYHPEHHTLVLHQDCFYTWQQGVWQERTIAVVRRIITRCVKKEFDRYAQVRLLNGAEIKTPQVTMNIVNNVQNALSSLINVTTSIRAGWLCGQGWPINEILVCNSSLINLVAYLQGKPDYWMQHTPRLFSTNKLQFDFDPEAPPPKRWLLFLDEVWPGDITSQQLLQEFFGYCLTPDVSRQKFMMFVGASRGGKGVTTRLLSELVGRPNYCAVRLSKISSQFGLGNVVGMSLILVPDANMPTAFKAAEIAELVKAVIGCDPLDINRKGRPIITSVLPAKIVISTNKMIALPDESAALYSRMLVLRFTRSFYGCEDTKLDETLAQELPGVLLWAIDGYRRLRENGQFTESPSGLLLKRQLRVAGASVASFVEDCCVVDPELRIAKGKLFEAYQKYCNELQVQPCELPQFSTQLMEAVASVDSMRPNTKDENGKRPRYYIGIDLKQEPAVESVSTTNNVRVPDDCQLSMLPIMDHDFNSATVQPIAV
jgi:putative DNA primase/helicase